MLDRGDGSPPSMPVKECFFMFEGIAAACLAVSIAIDPHWGVAEVMSRPDLAWLTAHPTIQRVLELENEERARYGLPALKLNPEMCKAAQNHATWMANTGYYTHSNLPWPEIIHSGPRTPEGAVTGWIYSPSHHGIMLSGREAGIGYAVRNGATYWVTVIQ